MGGVSAEFQVGIVLSGAERVIRMVAMKVNRINLLEINRITFLCEKCGYGIILDLEHTNFAVKRCPSCGADFSSDAEECFYRLRDACFAAKAGKGKFRLEFDIVEGDGGMRTGDPSWSR